MEPFLKWPGGKRWLIERINGMLSRRFDRYIEPFLGGGAVFFHLGPQNAILSDSNVDLIDTYIAVRDDWRKVQGYLERHQDRHSDEYYYFVRGMEGGDVFERASRFIYLNRTCWNGLYRVNKKGKFNVPKGTKSIVVREAEELRRYSELLSGRTIAVCDFSRSVRQAGEGDLVFVDPPYTVKHNLNGFVKYNEKLFSWEDQGRLFYELKSARDRGAAIVSTNANHESVMALYQDEFRLEPVERMSVIAGSASDRGLFTELVISANIE